MSFGHHLKNIVDTFVPESIDRSSSEYFKFYFQSTTLLTTGVLSCIYLLICMQIGFDIGAVVCAYLYVGHLILLMSLRNQWLSSVQITHCFGLLTITGLGVAIIYSGGPSSPVSFWYVSTVVVSFWFASKRVTMFWVALSVIQILLIYLGEYFGYSYPVSLNVDKYPFFKSMMAAGLIAYMAIVFHTFNKWRQVSLNELVALSRSKDRMLAMIAHDLNNPLMIYKINTECLREGEELNERMLSSFESLNKKMQIIIENLVLYDKLVNNHFKKQLSTFSLQQQIKQIIADFAYLAQSRKIEIHFQQTYPANQVLINSDKNALDRIITNLLSNALKYTPSGKSILVTLTDNHEIHITDQGVGLTTEMMEHLFDIYDHKNELIHATDNSHGIGLNIVKSLCDELGIKIKAMSEGKNCGTTFSLTLPEQAKTQQKAA